MLGSIVLFCKVFFGHVSILWLLFKVFVIWRSFRILLLFEEIGLTLNFNAWRVRVFLSVKSFLILTLLPMFICLWIKLNHAMTQILEFLIEYFSGIDRRSFVKGWIIKTLEYSLFDFSIWNLMWLYPLMSSFILFDSCFAIFITSIFAYIHWAIAFIFFLIRGIYQVSSPLPWSRLFLNAVQTISQLALPWSIHIFLFITQTPNMFISLSIFEIRTHSVLHTEFIIEIICIFYWILFDLLDWCLLSGHLNALLDEMSRRPVYKLTRHEFKFEI